MLRFCAGVVLLGLSGRKNIGEAVDPQLAEVVDEGRDGTGRGPAGGDGDTMASPNICLRTLTQVCGFVYVRLFLRVLRGWKGWDSCACVRCIMRVRPCVRMHRPLTPRAPPPNPPPPARSSPRQALAFPSSLTPAQLAAAAPQRSRSRVPALVWLHPASKAPLVRSSQPMAGMTTKVRHFVPGSCVVVSYSRPSY